MSSPLPESILPLPDGRQLSAETQGRRLTLSLDGAGLLALESDGHTWQLLSEVSPFALWAFAYWCFAHDEQRQVILLQGAGCPAQAYTEGLLSRTGDGLAQVERSAFWQLPQPWLRQPLEVAFPQVFRMDAGKRHPLRPPKPEGEVYRRFDARLGSWISLRTLDIDADLERFNRWQNHPRVLEFWQEGGSLAQHRAYLEKLALDPHALTLIGCFDDQPFAYFEAYWAKEDRIAPFYAADDYDRGIHMLVGEDSQRGPHKVQSWLDALVHYLLLDEPRTQRIVAEPRADNARMIGHMQRLGFWREKEFDFPHKRAALMVQSRESFFERCALR
ncbi:acetyltransferase [Pseudomonas sp. R3.Fl]|uniref:GNAT family N-acetyltransferase n=1 Tax=Pseudomonas TaxID=286 RepID=UPI00201D71EE|nr:MULTISPECIES: GNAT family N-acetyltransferase [Pseudomonas]MCL6687140.1 acetyltransferase [Pseudomonas sp. R3.Fl]UUC47520.1 acetyltransferase [Pseudomonas citronellolis]